MDRVIITWGSEWLWLELSKLFLQKGYEVICLSRKNPNIWVTHITTDLTDEMSISNIVEEIQKEYASFSCIINCAAVWHIEKLWQIDSKNTKAMFDVNLVGPALLASQLLSLIKSNEADLVYIGATIGYKANEFMPIYSVTKWGLRWLIENMRLELRSTKCRVISIHPGWLDTESNIGPKWRETLIWKITWKQPSSLMKTSEIAEFIYQTINTSKNIEISEVIINRK